MNASATTSTTTPPMKVTLLMDRSYTSFLAWTSSKVLYCNLMALLPKLISMPYLFRVAGYGGVSCGLRYFEDSLSLWAVHVMPLDVTPHVVLTDKLVSAYNDILKGQPFPCLGVNDVRLCLKQAFSGVNAADYVLILVHWPTSVCNETFKAIESVGNVTLVNCKPSESQPWLCTPDRVERHLLSLAQLSKRGSAAPADKKKPIQKHIQKPLLTPYESHIVEDLKYLFFTVNHGNMKG